MNLGLLFLALAMLSGNPSLVLAAPTTVSLTSIADATLFAESGDIASGADDGVFVGVNANTGGFSERRAALRFDLSAIPTNAVVQSATLTLFVNRSVNAGNVNNALHQLVVDWGDGTSTSTGGGGGGPATLNSTTWGYRFWQDAARQWLTAGGDYVASPSATVSVGNVVGSANGNSGTSFVATAGTVYKIAVDGFNGVSGNVALSLTLDSHPRKTNNQLISMD